MKKNTLVVIDMQSSFVDDVFCNLSLSPIFVKDSYEIDCIITSERKKFPMRHCMI